MSNVRVMSDYKYDYPETAERIRWHRSYLGLTQDAYAQKIGAKRSAVKNWESGKTRPGVDVAIEMCRVYAISLDWLLAGGDAGMPSDLLRAWRSRSD